MITGLVIENFRSIEHADLELAPVVALYGPTASGKSSFLYALLVLRNFVVDPNRPADGYFHLGFMDLGGFEACVFNHDRDRAIGISIYSGDNESTGSYRVSISKTTGAIRETWRDFKLECEVAIPYGLNQNFPFTYVADGQEYALNWNGIACTVSPKVSTPVTEQAAPRLAKALNSIPEAVRAVDIAPHRRDFSNRTTRSYRFRPRPPPKTKSPPSSSTIRIWRRESQCTWRKFSGAIFVSIHPREPLRFSSRLPIRSLAHRVSS